jgi:anti-sigma factor RsiW
MNCAELELLICDYVDGTLAPAERAAVERHLAECAACAEMARDSAEAVGFMQKAAEVEAPPELVTRILFDAPWTKGKAKSQPRQWLSALLSPILQPRYAMGMAMTVLSLAMLARFVTPVRQLHPSDLQPSKVWSGLEDRATRVWTRSMKYYDNLKVVYQIQTMLHEWQQQDEEQKSTGDRKATPPANDDRKLPVKSAPTGAIAPDGEPH